MLTCQLQLDWKNFALGDPWRIGDWFNSYVKVSPMWTHEERLKELECESSVRQIVCSCSVVTPADVKAFGREVFSRLFVETLIHGNTTVEVGLFA